MTHLFCTLDSQHIAGLIRAAERFVCYAGPGVQMAPAQAMAEVADQLGVEMAYESERARFTSGLKGLQLPNRVPAKGSRHNKSLYDSDIASMFYPANPDLRSPCARM